MSGREWTGPAWLVAALLGLLVVTGAGARPLLTVSFTSKPSDPSTSTEATFAFSADAQGAAFTCSLDGARATACRSPVTLRGLALGRHTFVVTAARRSERATARHEWTIVEPTARTAPLHVLVSGGGSISSSPAGIACPGDCTQLYALGSKVALTAKSGEGFVLDAWHGACAGAGGCTATISGTTFVRAAFRWAGKAPTLFAGDQDRDGVANARDVCQSTPPRAKLLRQGCALPDLLRDGDALLGGFEETSNKALRMTRRISKLKPVAKALARYHELVERGAAQLERGDVCGGARTVRRGTNGLLALARKSRTTIGRMQSQLLKKPSGAGDAEVKDLAWAQLHHRQALVEDVAEEAAKLRKTFGTAYSGLGRKVTFTGRVAKTDDAAGSLRLVDGRLVQLAARSSNNVWEGARVRVTGRRGDDGRVIAQSVVALDKHGFGKLAAKPCVSLLIAPVQPFSRPKPILHDPGGYRASGVLWLEAGMRIAATPEQCADADRYRYSLSVEALKEKKGFTIWGFLAADLVAADAPVPLTISGGWWLRVILRRQGNSCGPPKATPLVRAPAAVAKSYPCPVELVDETWYPVSVRPFGSYATAVYDKTIFDLESNPFAPAKVTRLEGVHDTLSSPAFEADAYKITGTQSATSFSRIAGSQRFAVWPEAWYGFPWLFPRESIGVDHYAGLVWPRVFGTRNGKPYRYAAQLPHIATDVLPNCPAGNCLYRLPWKAGGIELVTQGNNTPTGNPATPGHWGQRRFAFDFVLEDGEPIYATRGGVVVDLAESNTENFNPCVSKGPGGAAPNYVGIVHQDGTLSYYAHVKANSVIPAKGATVTRGDALAKVGNVGSACGSHLHYQVSSSPDVFAKTKQICFEGYTTKGFTFMDVFSSCFIPKTFDRLISTNG